MENELNPHEAEMQEIDADAKKRAEEAEAQYAAEHAAVEDLQKTIAEEQAKEAERRKPRH